VVETSEKSAPEAAGPGLVDTTRARLQDMLTEMLERIEVDKYGSFTFPAESARVFIKVHPFGQERTLVNVFAHTNIDVPASEELFRYIALHSNMWVFGHLGASERDDKVLVTLSHRLLGEHLQLEELKAAAFSVAFTADEIDDEIKERFGGRLFPEAQGVPVGHDPESAELKDKEDPRERYGAGGYL
jgi:hypothetical protein